MAVEERGEYFEEPYKRLAADAYSLLTYQTLWDTVSPEVQVTWPNTQEHTIYLHILLTSSEEPRPQVVAISRVHDPDNHSMGYMVDAFEPNHRLIPGRSWRRASESERLSDGARGAFWRYGEEPVHSPGQPHFDGTGWSYDLLTPDDADGLRFLVKHALITLMSSRLPLEAEPEPQSHIARMLGRLGLGRLYRKP